MQAAEKQIEKLNAEIAGIDRELADPALFARNAARAKDLAIERGKKAKDGEATAPHVVKIEGLGDTSRQIAEILGAEFGPAYEALLADGSEYRFGPVTGKLEQNGIGVMGSWFYNNFATQADRTRAFAAIDCVRGFTSAVTLISSTSIRPNDDRCPWAIGANSASPIIAAVHFTLRICIRPLFKFGIFVPEKIGLPVTPPREPKGPLLRATLFVWWRVLIA